MLTNKIILIHIVQVSLSVKLMSSLFCKFLFLYPQLKMVFSLLQQCFFFRILVFNFKKKKESNSKKIIRFYPKLHQVAKNIKRRYFFFIFIFSCHQIWANCLMDDCLFFVCCNFFKLFVVNSIMEGGVGGVVGFHNFKKLI